MNARDGAFSLLLARLGAGEAVSRQRLQHSLAINDDDFQAALEEMARLSIPLVAEGDAVQLAYAIELLSRDDILERMGPIRDRLSDLEVFVEVGSTNDYLLEHADRLPPLPRVCIGELQTKGRGRRGRSWFSPFGANLYCSLLWRWRSSQVLTGLSLALGVAAVETLSELGAPDIGLKWPNDLYWRGRKLAGMLIDVTGDSRRACDVVAGIGINVDMRQTLSVEQQIDQPWCDLAQAMRGVPSRNLLAAALVKSWLKAFETYERSGLEAFLERFARYDVCAGQPVMVTTAMEAVDGVARGINREGALMVETSNGLQNFFAADVSLRLAG